MVDEDDEAFIIGGAEVYRSFLPLSKRLYVTRIDATVDGDVLFPDYDLSEWGLVSENIQQVDDKNILPFRFCVYKRRD